MSELREAPAGTVTFLFTDIEGSTRLLDEVGRERFADLLAEHHRVCRDGTHVAATGLRAPPRPDAVGQPPRRPRLLLQPGEAVGAE